MKEDNLCALCLWQITKKMEHVQIATKNVRVSINLQVPLKEWYYDLSLAMIIMQFRNNQNKKDIIECVKYYDDGEYEILYTDYLEA